eukprot:SAG22_NODE_1308_length_4787_cov_3.561860_5_plen_121_part_00
MPFLVICLSLAATNWDDLAAKRTVPPHQPNTKRWVKNFSPDHTRQKVRDHQEQGGMLEVFTDGHRERQQQQPVGGGGSGGGSAGGGGDGGGGSSGGEGGELGSPGSKTFAAIEYNIGSGS